MTWQPMNLTLKQWTLPLAGGRWCYLFTPQPMTVSEWNHLMEYMDLYWKGLVSAELSVAKALEGVTPEIPLPQTRRPGNDTSQARQHAFRLAGFGPPKTEYL